MKSISIIFPILSLLFLEGSAATNVDCPGVLHAENDGDSSCCVGGTLPPVVLSTCPGWPVCTGPATTTQTTGPLSCATDIPVSVSDYNQLVASASSSLAASGTSYRTTLTNEGSVGQATTKAGATGGASSTSTSEGSTTTSGGSSGTSSSAAPASSNAAFALQGSVGVVGAYVLAVAGML